MYTVLIVDDEPISCTAIELLLKRKYRDLFSCSKFLNGKDALQTALKQHPDIVITDIRMPVMDGLELAKQLSAFEAPPIIVIISGYSDFTYAQSALRYQVVDYLLKPIVRDEFFALMDNLLERLMLQTYEKRNVLLKKLCLNEEMNTSDLKPFFPDSSYQLALIRYGGLPTRFSLLGCREIFSEPNDQILTYGRDDRESLYICSQQLLTPSEFDTLIRKKAEQNSEESLYYTLLFLDTPVNAENLQESIQLLYNALLTYTVIGCTTIFHLPSETALPDTSGLTDSRPLSLFEKYCAEKNLTKMRRELVRLFSLWSDEKYSQLWTEEMIHNIQYLLKKYHLHSQRKSSEEEYLISEALYNAENMQQLLENLAEIFFQSPEARAEKLDSRAYYENIMQYIHEHFQEPLTLQSACRDLGISQTYLSMIMRKYGDETFKNALTRIRMEYAQMIMKKSNKQIKIKDIAIQCGLHDQFQFSKVFHTYTGISPSDYMDQL